MLALVLALIATLAAATATATSTWQTLLLRRQLRSDEGVRSASFYQSVAGLFIQFDLLFLERPHLRPFFFENQRAVDSELRQQCLAVAEYIADMAEACTAAEDVLPSLVGDWDDYLNHIYRNSPALRDFWSEFGHLFPARVARAIVGPSARPKPWPRQVQHESLPAGDAERTT